MSVSLFNTRTEQNMPGFPTFAEVTRRKHLVTMLQPVFPTYLELVSPDTMMFYEATGFLKEKNMLTNFKASI